MDCPDDTKDSEPGNWATDIYKFTQSTTIDGVKQITEPTHFCFRRVLWICLLTIGITLLVKQLTDSVLYYSSYPMTVNLNINYNKTLKFPAITICNQNNFRATVASSRGLYSLISDLYVQNNSRSRSPTTYGDDFYSQSILNFMFDLKHDKEDLIVSCKWDNTNCSADDFVTSPTDHSVCYSFNSGRDDKPLKFISQAGSDGGLRLKLNIEQYEYMQGPNGGAGLEILIHDQGDVALVKDLGQAIQVGSHAYADINVKHVHNLPEPHGHCKEKNLTLYSNYTMSACLMECKTFYLISVCGCIDYYMPWQTTGGPPFCTIRQIVECARPALENFNGPDQCDCPVACDVAVFDPSITFLANSNFDVQKMLQNLSSLEEKYVYAQEVRQLVDTFVSQEDRAMATILNESVWQLNDVFQGIVESLDAIETETTEVMQKIDRRTWFHLHTALDGVHYVVKHNFIRGWEVIEERTLPYVTGSFYEVRSSVLQFFSNSTKDDFTEAVSWQILNELIQNKLYLCDRAKDNLTKINRAYRTGQPLLAYRKTLDSRYDLDFVSLELLHNVFQTNERKIYYTDLLESIGLIEDSLRRILTARQSDDGLAEALKAVDDFVDGCKQYNLKIYLFKDRIVQVPLKEIERRMQNFQHQMAACQKNVDMLLDLTFEIKANMRVFNEQSWQPLAETVNLFLDYVNWRNTTKARLADTFRSRTILMTLISLQEHLDQLLFRLGAVKDLVLKFGKSYLDLFENMLNEPSTVRLYRRLYDELKAVELNASQRLELDRYHAYLLGIKPSEVSEMQLPDMYLLLNADLISTNWTDIVNETEHLTNGLRLKCDHGSSLGQAGDAFINVMDSIIRSLKAFKGKNKIDHNFYRENFIHLDVFFHELSYQEVTHQIAYDVTNLLSDIGGLLDLFLGASVLSLFEIFDFALFTGLRRGRPRGCPCKSHKLR